MTGSFPPILLENLNSFLPFQQWVPQRIAKTLTIQNMQLSINTTYEAVHRKKDLTLIRTTDQNPALDEVIHAII